MVLDKEYFETQMKAFASFVGVDAPNILQANEYYEKFKSCENIKFHKIIRRLYDTWKYKHFPLLADFLQAQREVFAGDLPEYKPEPRVENVNKITKQKEWRRIIDAMKMLDFLEDRCKQKKIKWIPFITDMLKKDMVYLIKENVWKHNSKIDTTEDIFEPRWYYPPEYYK